MKRFGTVILLIVAESIVSELAFLAIDKLISRRLDPDNNGMHGRVNRNECVELNEGEFQVV